MAKKQEVQKKADVGPTAKDKSIRIPGDIHTKLSVRAATKGMTLGEYLEWMMDQLPLEEIELRRLLQGKKGG